MLRALQCDNETHCQQCRDWAVKAYLSADALRAEVRRCWNSLLRPTAILSRMSWLAPEAPFRWLLIFLPRSHLELPYECMHALFYTLCVFLAVAAWSSL